MWVKRVCYRILLSLCFGALILSCETGSYNVFEEGTYYIVPSRSIGDTIYLSREKPDQPVWNLTKWIVSNETIRQVDEKGISSQTNQDRITYDTRVDTLIINYTSDFGFTNERKYKVIRDDDLGYKLCEIKFTVDKPYLIRVFTKNDSIWKRITNQIKTPSKQGFIADLHIVEGGPFNTSFTKSMMTEPSPFYNYDFIIMADSLTFTQEPHTLLCQGLFENKGKSFRVLPQDIWKVENNLSTANMDFDEFIENCNNKGVLVY